MFHHFRSPHTKCIAFKAVSFEETKHFEVKNLFFLIEGEEDSGPIDGALASGDDETAKNLINVSLPKYEYFVIKFEREIFSNILGRRRRLRAGRSEAEEGKKTEGPQRGKIQRSKEEETQEK